ncbi:hypothetical protein ASAC_1411 [Acidilobus saccharovorans 345-15]|uniref:Uncharacterized protein n=1 Tax=Acidilobus saccharovorans (strain DSM 16705 / JCM 18335 / VKM B-2471 / 345-15) TaxID=666510 RepID=D9PZ29_ACIS3|nr:hypothetical protein [Acidilobus saccharovorans]ADL19816.1 hypothetical protein ASAC_1411 [Acidilobus saccharovorans 345-15]
MAFTRLSLELSSKTMEPSPPPRELSTSIEIELSSLSLTLGVTEALPLTVALMSTLLPSASTAILDPP